MVRPLASHPTDHHTTPIGFEETPTEHSAGQWQTTTSGLVPGLTVLYHPDLERIGERAVLPELGRRQTLALGRGTPTFAHPGSPAAKHLADPRLSRSPIQLRGDGQGGVWIDRDGSPTALVVDDLPTERHHAATTDLDRGVVLLLGHRVVLLLHRLDPMASEPLPGDRLVGQSATMLQVRREIRRIAPLDVPVLLRGESGTGKELVARALHDHSPRRHRAYVPVNLTAVPPSLAAAELFGADRGAFTGAHRARQGFFARADGGTLFLDEIGDASSEVQALLLRALESGEIQPLGEGPARRVAPRVVAATDRDLETGVFQGTFRSPLLHRLSGFVLRLPTLRQRRDDFGRLLLHLLGQELRLVGASQRLEPSSAPWLPAGLVARLARFEWPGNVRQLRNVVRQLAISYHDQDRVQLSTPLETLVGGGRVEPPASEQGPSPQASPRRPGDIQEVELLDALRAERWRLQATANRLAIPRSSLYRLIERCPRIRTARALGSREIDTALDRHGSLDAAAQALEVSPTGLRRRIRQLETTAP